MNSKEVLKKLCLADSPSGRENWLYPTIEEIFKPFGEISMGNLNNVYIHKKGKGRGKIMLMAHADEVSLMVTEISERGFLKFQGIGVDPKVLISQEVIVHGKKDIRGIIGIKPPHLMNDEEKDKPTLIEDLFIDTGFSDETLKEIVKVGDYVTISRKFYELLNNNVTCKAIDDRAGIAAMQVCAKELQRINHDAQVYFVCSCQEEVGHRGAKVACYDIKPDIGIAIDVTFDSGELGDMDRENKIGKGPSICIGPNVHPKVRKKLIEIAKEYDMKYQVEVESGNTGTDAWDIQIAGQGVPSLIISIPIRYMHTSVEVINIDDIKNTGRLVAKFIEKLSDGELEGLLCF